MKIFFLCIVRHRKHEVICSLSHYIIISAKWCALHHKHWMMMEACDVYEGYCSLNVCRKDKRGSSRLRASLKFQHQFSIISINRRFRSLNHVPTTLDKTLNFRAGEIKIECSASISAEKCFSPSSRLVRGSDSLALSMRNGALPAFVTLTPTLKDQADIARNSR